MWDWINYKNDKLVPTSSIPCSKRNLSDTFDDVNTSGFFYNGSWRPRACQLPVVDKTFLHRCLNGTQVLILGDSNSRHQLVVLQTMTGCQHKMKRSKETKHAPLQCDIDNLGLSIKYFLPRHPFYGSIGEDLPNSVLHSTIQIMDGIPASGKYLVHLHQFLHLMPFHLSVAEHHLRLVRAAIQRLVSRNPSVLVVYQTAHTALAGVYRNKQTLGVYLLELQRRMLRGLGDRVMLAVTWPMTLVSENSDPHPAIRDQFLKLYMGHLCGRF
ncbi:NXPE family member 3-like [Physella acuta]|uniref:NXPE family member 3-like n=1 Tax=Physella acuta TaxID=109671 RepID=UPI0027DB0FB7|nr:NXPE family member 3-like [Physella acuta]